MKKKLLIGIVAVILLIFLLPFPQIINRTFYGVNTENGEQVTITFAMKYLRFLLFDDKMYGTITVQTDTQTLTYGEHLYYHGRFPHNADDSMHNIGGWYYNETMYMKEYPDGTISPMPVGFEGLDIHVSTDFTNILILHNVGAVTEIAEKNRYIGSIKPSGLEEAKQYFSGYYN